MTRDTNLKICSLLLLFLIVAVTSVSAHQSTSFCPNSSYASVSTDYNSSIPARDTCSRDDNECTEEYVPLAKCDNATHSHLYFRLWDVPRKNDKGCSETSASFEEDKRRIWYKVHFTQSGIVLDTGNGRFIDKITVLFRWKAGSSKTNFTLEYSVDGIGWTPYSEDDVKTKEFLMYRDGSRKACLERRLDARFLHVKFAADWNFGSESLGTVDVYSCRGAVSARSKLEATTALGKLDAFFGCFFENRKFPEFSVNSGLPGYAAVNLWTCMGRCSNMGYKLAAFRWGFFCYCGNSSGKYNRLSNETCVYPVQNVTNSVFVIPTSIKAESVYIPNGTVTWNQVITITATFPREVAAARVRINVDFGDGRLKSVFCNHVKCHVTHLYTTFGQYTIKVSVVDFKGYQKYFEGNVQVDDPLEGVELLCPRAAGVGAPCGCLVSIGRGVNVTGSVLLGTETPTALEVPDPKVIILGKTKKEGSSEDWREQEPFSNYTAVTPDLVVTEGGHLAAFEVQVEKAGPIRLQVLRPNGPSLETVDNIIKCNTAEEVFVVNQGKCCGNFCHGNSLTMPSFTLIYDFITGHLGVGHHYASLANTTHIRVLSGDVVGVATNHLSGKLAMENQVNRTEGFMFAEPERGWKIGDVLDTSRAYKNRSVKLALSAYVVPIREFFIFNRTFRRASEHGHSVSLDLKSSSKKFSTTTRIKLQIFVTGLAVTVSELTLLGNETVYNITVQNGSDHRLRWNDSDGGFGSDINTARIYQVRRRYSRAGEYSFAVTVANLVSYMMVNCSTTVLNGVKGTSIFTEPSVLGEPSSIVFGLTSGSLVDMLLSFGDGSRDVNISGISLATSNMSLFVMVKNHTYHAVGAYSVGITAKNSVSQDSSSTIAYVQRRVEGFNMSAVPSFVSNEEDLVINMSIRAGTNATFTVSLNGVEISVDWQTKNRTLAGVVISREKLSVGDLLIIGAVYNLVSDLKHEISRKVLKPVANASIWMPLAVATRTVVKVSFRVEQGSSVTVTFRNGTGGETRLDVTEMVDSLQSVFYQRPGEYTLGVNFTNPVSFATAETVVKVYEPVSGLNLTANTSVPYPPGVINVVLDVQKPWPTNATFMLDFGDGNQTGFHPFTDQVKRRHRYGSPGTYKVHAHVKNPLGLFNKTVEVQVVKKITFLKVVLERSTRDPMAGKPEMAGKPGNVFPLKYNVQFILKEHDGSSVTSLRWDYGDNSINVSDGDTKMMMHKYQSVGKYNFTLTAVDPFGSSSKTIPVIIKRGFAGVHITDGSPVVANNSIDTVITFEQFGDVPAVVKVVLGDGQRFAFVTSPDMKANVESTWSGADVKVLNWPVGNITFTHAYSTIASFHATVTSENEVSKSEVKHLTVVLKEPCQYPSISFLNAGLTPSNATKFKISTEWIIYSRNTFQCAVIDLTVFTWEVFRCSNVSYCETPVNISTDVTQSYLVVPAFSLSSGLYRLHFNLTLRSGIAFTVFANAFIDIVAGDLKAGIFGGSVRSEAYKESILIDGSISRDLDLASGDFEGMTFTWFCHHKNRRNSSCYGDGQEKLQDSTPKIRLDTGKMIQNETYEITLEIRKGIRSSTYSQILQIVPGNPLSVFVSCSLNCGDMVNPSVKLVLEGSCSRCKPLDDTLYLWILYKKNGSSSDWRKVPGLLAKTATGIESRYLVIKRNVLEGGKSYKFVLNAWKIGETKGFTEFHFDTNSPPQGGTCSVDPVEGEAVMTQFTIKCKGWRDSEAPLSYKIVRATNAKDPDDKRYMVYHGPEASPPAFTLPVGQRADDFVYNITVVVKDALGSASDVSLSVKVKPPKFGAKEMETFTDQDGQVSHSMFAGDTQRLTQLIGSLSSVLDNQVEEEEKEALNDTHSGPSEHGHDSLYVDSDAKKARIKMREKLVAPLTHMKPESVSTVMQLATTLKIVTNKVDEMSENAQLGIASTVRKMVKFLSSKKKSTSAEILASAGGGVADCVANLFRSSTCLFNKRTNHENEVLSEMKHLKQEIDSGKTSKEKLTELNGAEIELKQLQNERDHFKTTARTSTTEAMDALDGMADIMVDFLVPEEGPMVIRTSQLTLAVSKKLPSDLGQKTLSVGHSQFKLPSADDLFGGSNVSSTPIAIKMMELKSNPFLWDDSAMAVNSYVSEMEVQTTSGSAIKIGGLSDPINITFPTETSDGVLLRTMVNAKGGKPNSHQIQLDENDVSFNAEITPINCLAPFQVLYQRNKPATLANYVYKWSFARGENSSLERTFNIFISNTQFNRTASGTHYLSILAEWDGDPDENCGDFNYTLLSYTASCLFWDKMRETFVGSGCEVGPLTTTTSTFCMCNHLTSFGGGMFVAPNPINFDNALAGFSNLADNFVVFATVMAIIGIYFILLVWAKWADKRDVEKVGLIPLPSNDPRDSYAYDVTIHTGYERGAGTTANVFIQLIGSLGDSDARMLKDPKHQRFKQGEMDQFLLTVPQSLGSIKSIHIWHDNGGKSPGWFLFRVHIRDIQTEQRWWFICDKWLAVEEGDGKVDRKLNVATKRELTKFKILFINTTRKNLIDGHLWLSVFTRPPKSSFTRVQRLSCCLTVLLCTLVANIMFFGIVGEARDTVNIGPIRFSRIQFMISIQSSFVVMPVNLLIVTIFRKLKPKEERSKKYEKTDEPDQSGESKRQTPVNQGVIDIAERQTALSEQEINTEEGEEEEKKKTGVFKKMIGFFRDNDENEKKTKKKFLFLHWCLYVAYALVFVASFLSGFFCILYGFEYGEEKSAQWLSCVMISFWQSVIIMQPFKVFLLAFFFALIVKDPNKEEDQDGGAKPSLALDEEFIPLDEFTIKAPGSSNKPPDARKLETTRQLRLKQKKMKAILWEIVAHLFVVLVVFFVAFGNHDNQSYSMTREATDTFVDGNATSWSLSNVRHAGDYWLWLQSTLVPSLYPWRKLYGYPQISIVANDQVSYVMGVGRVRQLRVQKDTCKMPKIFSTTMSECNDYYSWDNDEMSDFTADWTPIAPSNVTEPSKKTPWQYQSSMEAKSFVYMGKMATYRGGGYIVQLGPDNVTVKNRVDNLVNHGWIDRYTRALLAEVSIYNVNVNLLCVVTLAYELLPTGGGLQFINVQTIRLYRYVGPSSAALLVFEVVFAFALFKWIYRDIKNLFKSGRAHCKQVWNVVDMAITCLSVSVVGVYLSRLIFIRSAVNQFHADRSQFVSFQYVVLLNEVVNSLIAAVVLLLNVKFLRLLRFNRKVSVLSSSMRAASKPLLSFLVMFFVVMCAFCSVANLVMGPTLGDFRTFTRAMVSVMCLVLGQFDYYSMEASNRVIGPVFFFSFMVLVQFIILNMFVGILCEGFSEVRSDSSKQSSEYEMTNFMMNRFKALLGIFVEPPIRPEYVKPKTQFEEDVELIEDRADTVLNHMRSVCAEDLRQVKWLEYDKLTNKKLKVLGLALSVNETENDFFYVLSTLSKCSEEQLDQLITASRSVRPGSGDTLVEVESSGDESGGESSGMDEQCSTPSVRAFTELSDGEQERRISSSFKKIYKDDNEDDAFDDSDIESLCTVENDNDSDDGQSFHDGEQTAEAKRSSTWKGSVMSIIEEEADEKSDAESVSEGGNDIEV